MRGKRAKQYRKLMNHYKLTFGFREPYQVLVDAQIVQDASKMGMDLIGGLERTLNGKVKPMITQCSIRHLYALSPQPAAVINLAKSFERRRCNHHELENPLSTEECFSDVIDAKDSGTNKHRYVIASQEQEVRSMCREIKGVPLIYISRSVMILEPMSTMSEQVREREEKSKFRLGLKSKSANILGKRKRGEQNDESTEETISDKKKRKAYGVKGSNPLSMMKKKKRPEGGPLKSKGSASGEDAGDGDHPKKRRIRKRKSGIPAEGQDIEALKND